MDETQVATGSGKRLKGSDLRTRNYQSRSRCGKCGRTHMGVCRRRSGGDVGCFKCGQIGHFSRDCVVTIAQGLDPLCFHCSQRGHKKAHCPSLYTAGQVSAPAPGTLRAQRTSGPGKGAYGSEPSFPVDFSRDSSSTE